MRDCTKCKGTGKIAPLVQESEGGAFPVGYVFSPERTCSSCEGSGSFPPVDEAAIRAALKGRKGLRTAAPKPPGERRYGRSYYVWRMARFHGGVDITLPMVAGLFSDGDPYLPELDALADTLAKEYFKTDLAGAYRWGKAFGIL